MAMTFRDVFSSLWISMSCLFDCFRVRNRPRSRSPLVSTSEDVTDSSSLFAAEEKEDCAVDERENLVQRVGTLPYQEGVLKEVKLLKECGTLPETPAELRKAVKFSEQFEKSDMRMPFTVLQSAPDSPIPIRTEEISSESSPETPEEIQKVEFVAGNSENYVPVPSSMRKASPYATPRMITDDMQTPGTVYATAMTSLTHGNARIRSQFVYTVLNPIDSKCQLEELKEDNSAENLMSGEATTSPVVMSSGESVYWDASLSSWLNTDEETLGDASVKKPNAQETPGDMPIVASVARHGNEKENTPKNLPLWWDNGIPNSTTKYKEDQKVKWHATPFEQRLEKALSVETCVPQRKPILRTPITLEELEGQDTATSQINTTPRAVMSL